MSVFLGGISGVHNLPMGLKERIKTIAKRHDNSYNDVLGILKAMADSKIKASDLQITAKSTSAYQNKLQKKTIETWSKAKAKFKGTLPGNLYYSALRDIISQGVYSEYKTKL